MYDDHDNIDFGLMRYFTLMRARPEQFGVMKNSKWQRAGAGMTETQYMEFIESLFENA